MSPENTPSLSTAAIASVFRDEVAIHDGTIHDMFNDGHRLYCRAVLPRVAKVRPKDKLQGGVALCVTDHFVRVQPYVLRHVCTNGLIVGISQRTWVVGLAGAKLDESALDDVRCAIKACCDEQEFRDQIQLFRVATTDQILTSMELLSRMQDLSGLPDPVREQIVSLVHDEFDREDDRTRYGLMNAVTAVARETRDPDLRWKLEEVGAAIGMALERRKGAIRIKLDPLELLDRTAKPKRPRPSAALVASK